mgnify:CR=1 FL=1|tara:strand:+ start:17954 stop:18148 length:195 start_codon:yes stop_codon:yes gene_type:complete
MAESDKKPSENETILMALDQVSQTIDVMTSVVGRLRNYLQQQQDSAAKQNTETSVEAQRDRVLH